MPFLYNKQVTISNSDKIIFFKVIHGDIRLDEFEKWLYKNKDLEKVIPQDYLDLVELNYKNSGTRDELYKKLETIIDFGEYGKWKLNILLDKALAKDDSFATTMMEFYDLYCEGYYFLNDLGLGFGLMFRIDNWERLNSNKQTELINEFYPKIEKEIKKLKDWINNEKIILTGKRDELNYYCFEDHRTEDEKKSEVWIPMPIMTKTEFGRKKWWRFWD